jgi:transposase-like protein
MPKQKSLELNMEQFNALLDRIELCQPTEEDFPLIADILRYTMALSQTIENKDITIYRLRKLFGFKTERTKHLPNPELGDSNSEAQHDTSNDEIVATKNEEKQPDKVKSKRKGNKTSAKDYKNAIITKICHVALQYGDRCPECKKGNLRRVAPSTCLRIRGQPWLQAQIYELERFRCNSCGKIFTAKLPKDVATESKYDTKAKVIVCLLKYRGGFPFYRQESLQNMLETPISDSELWGMTRDVALCLVRIFEILIMEASKGDCIRNDDTKARVLDIMSENKGRKEKERKGIFTSAILSTLNDLQIALFFTGRQHAGENLDDVLDNRPDGMTTPTQMCDSSDNNSPDRNITDESNCLAHLRRKFYDVADIWPKYTLPIIFYLNIIFRNEYEAKELGLDESQTFGMHKEKSASVMNDLNSYCKSLIDDKKTEPNSSLGKAIQYMFNHWEEFTLFLRKPGVPIDNNANERLIKRAVLNRKNGLFFKTQFGAYVGDILLSVIETCQLNKINPYNYLIAVQEYSDRVNKDPSLWLPWNYEETMLNLGLGIPAGNSHI